MTPFAQALVPRPRPDSISAVALPRRERYFPSPADWRDEVLYFLLPDRFSDGREGTRPLLNRANLPAARPAGWRWDRWAESGGGRWQGGTINGLRSKLPYLKGLGVTAVWVGPVFKQRGHLNTYHGYGIQDFLEVDPRLGTRKDLVDLVAAAHDESMRIILDVIFNHSGHNWDYPGDAAQPPYRHWPDHYAFGRWLDAAGGHVDAPAGQEDGVWPVELQQVSAYTRAGMNGDPDNSLGKGAIDDEHAEHKRCDFFDLRDFSFDGTRALHDLAACYNYWIALTDCDGFRIDTVKHLSFEQARNFCGAVREFAANLGKDDFFLVGEMAGGDSVQDAFLDVIGRNMNAALDIGQMRLTLRDLGKGLRGPRDYFASFDAWDPSMGSHRNLGRRHVSILDDHDHVFGEKTRFSTGAASDHQVVAAVAVQLFSLGIPCVYYGTEQALAGPEAAERQWVPEFGSSDRYLREAMFGPEHPRKPGVAGAGAGAGAFDPGLPGFGPFGTAGHHCFDEKHPAYVRIAALADVRARFPVLRKGRQYRREVRVMGAATEAPGELVAWSRVLTDEEALVVVNTHGNSARGGDVTVDASLNGARTGDTMTVVANTAEAGSVGAFGEAHAVGSKVPVLRGADGGAFVEIRDLPASEVLVLVNRA